MTIYEVREQPTKPSGPEDRGTLVRTYLTFAEARAAAERMIASGRNVFISKAVG